MRRSMLVAFTALSLTLITNGPADAQRRYGGGYDGYGFAGGGYRGVSPWGGGAVRSGWYARHQAWGYARPVWGGGSFAAYRPAWGYGPSWGYRLPAYGAGFGSAMAAYYGDGYYGNTYTYRPYISYRCGGGKAECAPAQ